MKKKHILLTCALAGVAALSLTGFAGCDSGKQDDHAGEAETGTYQGIGSTESVYGVAAVTTAKLLNAGLQTEGGAQSLAAVSDTGTGAGTAGTEKAREELGDFNKYFNMLDTFLDKAATKTVVVKNTAADGPLAEYEFKLTVTGKDAAGKDVSHDVYFTETKGISNTDTQTDRDGETETTVSTVYTLEGAVDMGTDEAGDPIFYYMTGTRTELEITETDGRETETERTDSLVMKSSAVKGDERDYVLLTHTQTTEAEGNETESESLYTYQIFADGRSIETTAVGFEEESEHGETETEYTVAFQSGASRGIYTIEREIKGNTAEIVVEYLIDGTAGTFTIVKNADGTYRYRFAGGSADEILDDFFD